MKFLSFRKLPKDTKLTEPPILLATWFGAGLIQPAPGTWGSLAAIPFGYVIMMLGGIPALLAAIAICFWVGIGAADTYQKRSGEKDSGAIVIDEVAGMWIAAIPAGDSLLLWALAFLLFRLFDIWKPWPCSRYNDKENGSGYHIMMDDICAGFYAFPGVAAAAAYMMG